MQLFLSKYRFRVFLLFISFTLSFSIFGQNTINILGSEELCLGDIYEYTPEFSNSSYNYNWSIVPNNMGTILSNNSLGAAIHWNNQSGTASVNLEVTDINNQVIYTGSLSIIVHESPSPFITTNTELACQPLQNENEPDGDPLAPEFEEQGCQLVCAHSEVTYYANGNVGSSFEWIVSGALGQSSNTGLECVVEWGDVGFGQVLLIETTSWGCIVETSYCVEVIEKPTAYFLPIINPVDEILSACTFSDIYFIDLSTSGASSPIISYLWDWGDGHQTPMSAGASNSSVSHQYANAGNYTISLTVVNACGCSDTYTQEILITEGKAIEITCPRVVCEGDVATYSIATEEACSANSWSVIGGSIISSNNEEAEIIWNNVDATTGFGMVMYESCGEGCNMIVSEAVPVILRQGSIQGPEVICEEKQYIYRMPKWPSTEFNWHVTGPAILEATDQRNEIALRAIGSGSIQLFVEYHNTVLNCGSKTFIDINILPAEEITGPEVLCQNSSGSFSLSGTNSGDWELINSSNSIIATGAGLSFSYTFNDAGTYKLRVTGAEFCSPESHFISVQPQPNTPDSIVGPAYACAGIPTKYKASNVEFGTTFKWFVSGGGTVNASLGDFTYVNFNTFPAIVSAVRITTDGLSCTSDTLHFNVEGPFPSLAISGSDTVCHSTIENYSVNYTEADYYNWKLSHPLLGSVVSDANSPDVAIQWNIPPNAGQDVFIIAKVKKCGIENIITYPVHLQGAPFITSVDLLPSDTVCSGTPITLQVNTLTPLNSGIFTVNWGDGVIQTYNYPTSLTHTYHTTGSNAPVAFSPTVTLEHANGCEGSVTVTAPSITVMPAPATVLSPTGAILTCSPIDVWLNASVTTGVGGTNTYEWFPGGPGGSSYNATDTGEHYVVVTNSVFGCSSISNTVIIVDTCILDTVNCPPPPDVSVSYIESCGDISVFASITGGEWIVDNISTLNLINYSDGSATATALAAGLHTFNYVIEYSEDCKSKNIIGVEVPYIADLRYDISCDQANEMYKITLYDHSTEYPIGRISERAYYEGSTLIGTGLETTIYQAPGTTHEYYQVIGDGQNPSCTSYVSITTPDFPEVDVFIHPSNEFMPGCVDDVAFQLGHQVLAGAITSYYWDFDDDSYNMSSINPIGKVYDEVNPKRPNLTVTDIHGCWAKDSVEVEITKNNLEGSIFNSGSPVCEGTIVNITYNNTNQNNPLPTHYYWHEQTEQIHAGTSPIHSVTESGGYWVLGMDQYGCKIATGMTSVEVIQLPPINIMGPSQVCVNQNFTLSVPDYGPDYMYVWSGSATGIGTSLNLNLSTPGTYTYQVMMTDLNSSLGCTQMTMPFTVTVHPPPDPPLLNFEILSCDPYLLELTATGVDGTYNWSNGMSGQVMETPFGGHYQVILTDHNGCVVDNTITVPKDLEEYIWVFPKGCFCQYSNASVVGPLIALDWTWFVDGLVASSAYGVFPPQNVSAVHNYQLGLKNNWCEIKSAPMYMDSCFADDGSPILHSLIQKKDREVKLEVVPNPTNDKIRVFYELQEIHRVATIELIDINGRVLEIHELLNSQGFTEFSLGQYASGFYQIVLKGDGLIIEKRKVSLIK